MQGVTEDDYARTLNELDRLLNDPDVPLRPGLIWRLLDKVSEQDRLGGTTLLPPDAITATPTFSGLLTADQKVDRVRAPS
jgi:hypothetical protein